MPYKTIQPITTMANGEPWQDLVAPHVFVQENFQRNYGRALQQVDHALLIMDDLGLNGPDPALHNEVADAILEALKGL